MNDLLETIGYPLPEDIEKLKWAGYFDECLQVIDQRMKENIPNSLRRKLEMEKIQIGRMRRNYTVTPEEAERVLAEHLRDYHAGELDQLRRENVLDWIFVEGQVRYISSFYENLIKIRGDIAARQLQPRETEPGRRTETEIRDDTIAFMKAHGGAVCRIQLRATIKADLSGADPAETVRLWLPYPIEGYQVRNLKLESCIPAAAKSAPPDTPQRTLYFEGKAAELSQAEIVYSFENHTRYVNLDPDQTDPKQPSHKFLGEELPHITFTPYLRALTAEVVGEETNALRKARRIYDFITTQVNYSYMRSYLSLPVIPEYCASRLRGDCGVQALTFITMCRIAGIPARWQSGLYANENEAWSHDWAMFYVAPFGWLFADCSYGGAAWRDSAKERWDFYFGNLDPYRVVLASEFQKDFTPATKYVRGDPYDNQHGEAELAHSPLDPALWMGEAEVLVAELLPPSGNYA